MDVAELRALLEAATRELGSVVADLPKDDEDEATSPLSAEILLAAKAVAEAAKLCTDSSAHNIDMLDCQPSEILREAHMLRGEAVRARDVAEARLWSLQDEHVELLERLRELSTHQQANLDEQYAEANAAASREGILVERCAQLNNEVRALRKDVDEKSQRLIASSALGHSLELNKRKLQRQHEGSLVENAVAREILALQQSTESYMQRVNADCNNIDLSLESAQKSCAEKMESLQAEWSEEQAKYENDTIALQAQLSDLQQRYQDRWKANELSTREELATKVQRASEQRRKVDEQLAKLDEEWEKEASASRRTVDEQKKVMFEARQVASLEMEAKLEARTQQMGQRVDIERRRGGVVFNRELQKSEGFHQEINHYKKRIGELAANYRRRRLCSPSKLRP
jgi:hypothetical protein